MINKKEFKAIREELENYDKQREVLIKESRTLLKLSKQIIYSVHRGNMEETEELLKDARDEKAKLDKITRRAESLSMEHSYSDALQEYTEALCYSGFVSSKKLPSRKTIGVNSEDYLMGLCDLTGELGRRAVSLATKRKFKEVEAIKKLVEDIYGEFLKFNLRNSSLRKKSDSIKWNLKKIEEIMYDLRKHH
ncbi:hypothetical protein CMO89_03065 [Candidatus Woesearchaeota archaeon]|nr:hypothetical protein [Candidatus Woesearchaeota archaeon]|tara:strand:+ start:1708 stop:2283 length:576 start_codon:yes stop_codon:yes gene_type:complete